MHPLPLPPSRPSPVCQVDGLQGSNNGQELQKAHTNQRIREQVFLDRL